MIRSFSRLMTGFSLLFVVLLLACVACAESSVSGFAYLDADGNGKYSEGDTLLQGVPVTLQLFAGEDWQSAGQTTTDASGSYSFTGLEDGKYRVASALSGSEYCEKAIGSSSAWEDGFVRGEPLVLTDGTEIDDQNICMTETRKISIFVFLDSDGDGVQGKYEKAVSGVTAECWIDGGLAASDTTGKKGEAELCVPRGSMTLKITAPNGYGLSFLGRDSSFGGTVQEGSLEVTVDGDLELTAGVQEVSTMSGTAFEDINNNGIWDDGEPGVSGVVVYASGEKTGTELQTVTDENGNWNLILPGKDTYTLSADLPDGMLFARYSKTGGNKRSIFTGSNLKRKYNVKAGSVQSDLNIGCIQRGAITGYAFLDLNYNGVRDEGEPGYAGVTVEAIKVSSGDSYGKTTTDAEGYFILENLRGGDYTLRAVLPEDGSIFSATAEGDPAEVNRFAQRGTRRENTLTPLTIESGAQLNVLIGVAQGASISGTVFQDADYSGVMNGKEKALSGIKVRAVDESGNVIAQDTTGKNGKFILEGIMPGTYQVQFQRKSGFGFTRCRAEENHGSRVKTIQDDWGICDEVTLSMGETVENWYAGMLPSAVVEGNLYHDANDNGVYDRGESGVTGARVHLWSDEAEMDFVVSVAEDGSFRFAGVMPGTYNLEYLLPENTIMTGNVQQLTENAVTVAMGDSIELEDALAVKLGIYCGTVRNSVTGEAVTGAVITLIPSGNSKAQTAQGISESDGSFTVKDLRPAEYTLSVELPEGLIFAQATDTDGLVWPEASSCTQEVPWEVLTAYDEKTILVVVPATISGIVWMDENKDGTQGDSEWVMDGLTVNLLNEAGETVASCETTSDGYMFENLRPGTYSVRFDLPAQASPAADASTRFRETEGAMQADGLTVSSGDKIENLNVGLVSTTSLGGTIRMDENGERSALAGVHVELLLGNDAIAQQVTGEDGQYQFDGLWPDEYVLRVTLPDGAIFIRQDDPNYSQNETVVYGGTDSVSQSDSITLLMAQHQLDLDILCIKPAMVGDIAWLDENGNGVVDGDEPRIPGITVRLLQNGEPVYETTTDAFGYYLFSGVYPGTYVLEASAYEALTPTQQIPSLRIISSCLVSGDGLQAQSESFSVQSGSKNMNYDLGYILRTGYSVPEEITAEKPSKNWSVVNDVQTGSLGDPSVLKHLN